MIPCAACDLADTCATVRACADVEQGADVAARLAELGESCDGRGPLWRGYHAGRLSRRGASDPITDALYGRPTGAR